MLSELRSTGCRQTRAVAMREGRSSVGGVGETRRRRFRQRQPRKVTRGNERLRQLGWGNKRFKFPSGEEPLTQKMKKTGWNERDKKRAEGEKRESRAWRCVWTVDCEGPWGRPVSPWPPQDGLEEEAGAEVRKKGWKRAGCRFGCSAKRNGRLPGVPGLAPRPTVQFRLRLRAPWARLPQEVSTTPTPGQ